MATGVQATEYVWNGASGNNWNDSSKWLPSTSYPGVNDTAVFTNVGNGTVNLNGAEAANAVRFAIGAGDFTLSGGTLTLGAGGMSHNIQYATETLNCNVLLNADTTLQHVNAERYMYFNGWVDNAGHLLTIDGSRGPDFGVIQGAGNVRVKAGGINFQGVNTFTGELIVENGAQAVVQYSGTFLTASNIAIRAGGTLTLGDTGSTVADDGVTTFGRIKNTQSLSLGWAVLNVVGQGNATTERVDRVTVWGDCSWINVQRATLIPSTLTRDPDSRPSAAIVSDDYNLGSGSYLKPADSGASLPLIGGDGLRTVNKPVVPFLMSRTKWDTFQQNPNTLVTYSAATGLATLNPATDFVQGDSTTTFPAVHVDGNDNVRLPYTVVHPTDADTTLTLGSDMTINSLVFDGDYSSAPASKLVTLTGAAGRTLTVKSGVVMCTPSGGNAGRGTQATLTVPTLAFGAAEGVIHMFGRDYTQFRIGSAITGSNGLTLFSGNGGGSGGLNVTLSGDNSGLTGQISMHGVEHCIEGSVNVLGTGSNDLFISSTVYNDVGMSGDKSVTVKSLKGFGTLVRRYNSASLNVGGRGAGGAASTLTLLAGGTVQPGATNQAGTLTLQNFGAVRLWGGTLALDLLATNSYDRLSLTGSTALTINGTLLNVNLGYVPSVGETFLVVSVSGSTPVSGTFSNPQDTVTVPYGDRRYAFDILYNSTLAGGDGNDIVLRCRAVIMGGTVFVLK